MCGLYSDAGCRNCAFSEPPGWRNCAFRANHEGTGRNHLTDASNEKRPPRAQKRLPWHGAENHRERWRCGETPPIFAAIIGFDAENRVQNCKSRTVSIVFTDSCRQENNNTSKPSFRNASFFARWLGAEFLWFSVSEKLPSSFRAFRKVFARPSPEEHFTPAFEAPLLQCKG